MTTPVTPRSSDETYPLSPFQRAALRYAARPLSVTLEVPLSLRILVERAKNTLLLRPELTANVRSVPGLLIPRQIPNPPAYEELLSGGWRLVAGSLSLTAEPGGAGTRLTIDADALVADSVSIELLCEGLDGSASVGKSPSFFDIAGGHAAMLQEGELDEEKAHWQAIPQGDDARVTLGCEPSSTMGRTTARVPVDYSSLAAFASAHGVELADVLCLSLHLLLDRVCPKKAVVGCLIDTRGLLGLEKMSGLFTQVTLDVAEVDPETPPIAFLKRQVERRREHEAMAGGPALTENQSPPTIIFDPRMSLRLPVGWRLVNAFEGRSGALLLSGSLEGKNLSLVGNVCDGTEAAKLRTMLTAWADVVAAIVREPNTPWSLLQLGATGNSDRSVTDSRAQIDRENPEDICARVSKFAASDPKAGTIRHGRQLLTREELLGRISDLAAALGPQDAGAVVAVLANTEHNLIAGWLAVLWRGAAFLPLLPVEPRQRIESALVASGACAVLVGDDAPAFSAPVGCRTIPFRDVKEGLGGFEAPVQVNPEQSAYLLRTSGSSGVPKLVAVSRGNLNNYLRWVAEELLTGDGSDFPVVSSPIFDASFKQLLGPQYAGRPTWLLGGDPADTASVYAELQSINAPLSINCTPTYWAELLNIGAKAGRRLALCQLLLGGEPISERLLQRTGDEYPEIKIWNLYGPTEATANATMGRLTPGQTVHVGRAIAGATVTVADQYGRPLPHSMRGEVWISGPGVAKGYLGGVGEGAFRRLQVGERTIPAYHSGDAGSIDEYGNLRLCGRLDTQLKVRGWRIEPQEIERVAETTPGVVDARLVLDTRTDSHELRLFFMGEAEDASILKVLREWLPAAMVPATVMRISRFPMTATGKLDHRALLNTVSTRSEASPNDYDPLQFEVATIWRDVLGRGWPHLDEDFFNAGGHSLLLARLVNRLRASGHNQISLRQVVRNPTVNFIATIIRGSGIHERADAPPCAGGGM